jgi:hypothetical protein
MLLGREGGGGGGGEVQCTHTYKCGVCVLATPVFTACPFKTKSGFNAAQLLVAPLLHTMPSSAQSPWTTTATPSHDPLPSSRILFTLFTLFSHPHPLRCRSTHDGWSVSEQLPPSASAACCSAMRISWRRGTLGQVGPANPTGGTLCWAWAWAWGRVPA